MKPNTEHCQSNPLSMQSINTGYNTNSSLLIACNVSTCSVRGRATRVCRTARRNVSTPNSCRRSRATSPTGRSCAGRATSTRARRLPPSVPPTRRRHRRRGSRTANTAVAAGSISNTPDLTKVGRTGSVLLNTGIILVVWLYTYAEVN